MVHVMAPIVVPPDQAKAIAAGQTMFAAPPEIVTCARVVAP